MKTVAIVGPTASGKTALSIAIALQCGGEILSCDSMQIYREMDIGTAKATQEEQAMCPHHLIDLIAPTTPFSAADYAAMAEKKMRELHARGVLPVFCGGTGLYLEAVRTLRHEAGAPPPDPALRASLQAQALTTEGKLALYATLQDIDPDAASATHPNNTHRVIRALEVFYTTGKTKTAWDKLSSQKNPDVDFLTIGLDFTDRAILYHRIDTRVDAMLERGLLEETRSLFQKGYLETASTASQAIGYKELLGYLKGECSLEEAVETLKTASRRYAKRQLTWFRRDPSIVWIWANDGDRIKTQEELLQEAIPLVEHHLSI